MNPQWPGDFDAMARQYWAAWNNLLMPGAAPANPFAQGFGTGWGGAPGWQGAMDPSGLAGMFERMGGLQGGGWYPRMQGLAMQFAGTDATSKAIADAWRQMLQGDGGAYMVDALRGIQAPGAQGFDAWHAAVQPLLQAWRMQAADWLRMPAFGLAREHQERLQALAQAQIDYQDALSAHNTVLARAGEDALKVFESLLARHEAAGKQLGTPRALFDLWIDAAEQAYARVALSPEYRAAYGAMVNAQMRLRAGVQREVEATCSLVGMPTRTELDSAHRKIAELERELRRQRKAQAQAAPAKPKPAASKATAKPPVAKAAASKVAKNVAKKPAARTGAPGRSRR